MPETSFLDLALVFLIAAVVAVLLFKRLGFGAVLGYLAAGVAIGPHGLGLIAEAGQVLSYAEFGIVLLMFLLGLELSPERLWKMRRFVFGLGSLQLLVTTAALAALANLLLDNWLAAFVVGLALAQSSTAIAMRVLAERGEVTSRHGRVAFSISLFQDMTAVPILAVIPLMVVTTGATEESQAFGSALLKTTLVIIALVMTGRYLLPHVFRLVSQSRLVEVFSATALLVVVFVAWLMEFAGLSVTLGAFLAGVMLAGSEYRHEIESHIQPYKGLLLGLFFMGIGMSVDLSLLWNEAMLVIGAVAVLLLVKGLILVAIGRALGGMDLPRAMLMAALISAGGEFGFVVGTEGLKAGLLDEPTYALLITVASLSMALTPLLALIAARLQPRHPVHAPEFDRIEPHHARVIVAGFGRVGQMIGRLLAAQRIPFTALENSPEQVDFMRRFGNRIYFGDPARPEILEAAGADQAEVFVLTTDDPEANLRTARLVRRRYPHLRIFARARNRTHAFRLMELDLDGVSRETLGCALELGQGVLQALGMEQDRAAERVRVFREHDERLIARQRLFHTDEQALVASDAAARRELETLFEADIDDDDEDAPMDPGADGGQAGGRRPAG